MHYNFVDCKAKINFYKSQVSGSTKLSTEHHGHVISEDLYNRLNVNITEEETELIKTLAGANARPSQIKKLMLEKSKKRVTVQKIRNIAAKILPPENDEECQKAFEQFLVDIENDGGIVEWELDPDETVKCLFITSKKMKSAFRNTNPPVIQMDTSFNMDKAQYKVAAMCYLDPNTCKTEIAAISLLSQETASSFEFILKIFATICIRQDVVFLVDKDFTEVSTLKKVFPSSIVLLCIFHALKFICTLVSSALARTDKKGEIFDQFKKVLYSRSVEIFEKENKVFVDTIKTVEVKAGDKYVMLDDYYRKIGRVQN